ncbi:MAG: methionyl-tRNA formyltransferase [Muribaculaceae bacterium]|nr:methionyl-tRNA formyltransferase [Muribaculaceae bacterium]
MTKKDLRIVFFGTPDFAVESLRRLVEGGYNIAAVVTMPDKPAGRGHKLLHSPVKQYALEAGLRLLQPVKLKDPEFVDELRSLHADLFIVIAFRMLPEVVWAMPPLGTFNLHASLLPRYRGAAPINRAVMNGDTRTGVTTFMLKHEIDTGDILRREEVEILPDDNVGDVHDRLMYLGADLTLDTVDHIIAGDLTPIPQDRIPDAEPCPAPKIFAEDCIIDWTRPAEQIHNQVRGLSPYPAARSAFDPGTGKAEIMKIFKTRIVDCPEAGIPGTVTATPDLRMIVTAGDRRAIELLEVLPAGKKRMTAEAFLRGARLDNPHFSTK